MIVYPLQGLQLLEAQAVLPIEGSLVGDFLYEAGRWRVVVKHIFDVQHVQEEVQNEWRVPQAFLLDALEQLLEGSFTVIIHIATREGLLELPNMPLLDVERPYAFLDLLLPQSVELILAGKVDDIGGLLVSHDVECLGG